MSFYNLSKNKIFSWLFLLTGYARNEEGFVQLLHSKGFEVTINRVRGWRRDLPQGKPVPDFAIQILIDEMFAQKRQIPSFCELTKPSARFLAKFPE